MSLLYIALTSTGSFAVLFLLTKLIGNKQLSELNMFDYINSITIGSIAAEMATSLEDDFLKPLVAMIIYGFATFLISLISTKSIALRRFLNGKTITLFNRGQFYYKNFHKARLDLGEFLTQCRINGCFNLEEIELASFEPNGKISIMPTSKAHTATAGDLNLSPAKARPTVSVISDGTLLEQNLKETGNTKDWLLANLKTQGITDIKDVFLATCDNENHLIVYKRINISPPNDIFQ